MINSKNKRAVNIRIDQSIIDYLTDNTNKSINPAMVEALTMYKALLSEAEKELRGRFTPREWAAMADCYNGSIIETNMLNKQTLLAGFEDGQAYDATFTRHEINYTAFMNKCDKLTHAQAVALYNRIRKFWNAENADLYAWSQF